MINVTVSTISNTIKGYMAFSPIHYELAKDIDCTFRAYENIFSKERNNICKLINIPFVSSTSLTYLTQAHYHLNSIEEHIDQL